MEEQLRLSIVRADGQRDGEPVSARPTRPADTNPPRRLDELGDVLTVEEAAQVLRISRASAYELARRWRSQNPSGLPVIQLGRFLRVPKSALEQVLARPGELYATLVPADDRD
ncbi:MAG TPA: helix-turn-helix domain-containing protein [Microthrixaceae bacterium]|nr:helix-turn-helix domain-containing protein [Microthrixaceae bacterium]HMT25564.1 helix-turn-helix domain-containing protein [Microthrixaceae bacterium]HMT61271.1 helix-turn-helix domain-containing protein [Microthrixaceae bacterium]